MIAIDYHPLLNSGHTMRLAGELDSSRLYSHPTNLKLSGISIWASFEFKCSVNMFYGEYLVLMIGEDIIDAILDYNTIISLN